MANVNIATTCKPSDTNGNDQFWKKLDLQLHTWFDHAWSKLARRRSSLLHALWDMRYVLSKQALCWSFQTWSYQQRRTWNHFFTSFLHCRERRLKRHTEHENQLLAWVVIFIIVLSLVVMQNHNLNCVSNSQNKWRTAGGAMWVRNAVSSDTIR